ncbi:MAG: polysaccharide pyruvyl transferase CsaB [Clostridiaceae bacterium]|nr:polysaccharide pyruvyl transferase CsaB [Clostridiaceae bacterium]
MRILHIIGGGDVGGAKTAVISEVARLRESIDVKLVSFRKGDFAEEACCAGIETEVIETRNIFSDYKRLYKIVSTYKPDILHCHGARANLMGTLIKRALGLPVVTTIHSDYKLDYLGSPLRQLTFGAVNACALRKVDYYTCVSDRMARTMISRGFDPQSCFVIYNGIDYTAPIEKPDRCTFWKTYGYEYRPGDVVCVIAARLTKIKDIPTLLRAMRRAVESAPKLHLVIAGDGEDRESLLALTRELELTKSVTFAGWVKDMRAFFAAADINVICSLSETFPYSVSEGIREGCATVVSDVGGLSEMVEHGVSGFIFQPRDAEALAKAISSLALDEVLRRTFAERLFKRASTRFSLDRMAADQIEIYRTVLRRYPQKKERAGVTVCGAYGKGNAGDDAILDAIVRELRDVDPDMPIRVLSRNPAATRLDYRVNSMFTFHIPAVLRAFKRSRLYINGGGSLIQDVTSARSLWFYLWTLQTAKRMGLSVMMYGCGIGPLLRKKSERRATKILNGSVDAITLREDDSRKLLESLGVKKPEIISAADPALTLLPASEERLEPVMDALGLSHDDAYIAVCVRPWAGFDPDAIAEAAEYAYGKYHWTPVLLPIELPRDAAACDAVAERITCPYIRVESRYPAEVTIGLFSKMRGVLAMRLHALVFAAAAGVPAAGISYDVKVAGFLRYLGTERFCELKDATPETLCSFINGIAEENREAVLKNTERLRRLEYANRMCAAALLKK